MRERWGKGDIIASILWVICLGEIYFFKDTKSTENQAKETTCYLVLDVRQSATEEEVSAELGISNCSLDAITPVFILHMLQASTMKKWYFLKSRSQTLSLITCLLAYGDFISVSQCKGCHVHSVQFCCDDALNDLQRVSHAFTTARIVFSVIFPVNLNFHSETWLFCTSSCHILNKIFCS